ncbi:MAG TPA: dimethylsulfonioproprionate lyase family protein [Kofleriaceae bacterium]
MRELLPLYALGELSADEASAVERAIETDANLAIELESYLDLVAVTPPADIKARLIASVGGGRFDKLGDRIAKLLDVTLDRARELLGMIERSSSWENPVPGVSLIHFEGGPAYAAADCGFVRIAPGCKFPWHTHRGEEVSIILTGAMRDHDGKLLRAGDELVHQQGTQHELTAEGDDAVIYVARAMNGIEVGPPQ